MKLAIAVFTLILTSGCVVEYGPYDPDAHWWRGGYSEHRLAPDIYEVIYAAGCCRRPRGEPALQHYDEDFRLLRCAELTLENGYQYFIVEGGISPSRYSSSRYSRRDTYVMKMFVTKPDVGSLVFVYHAETVQQELRTRYGITPHASSAGDR